MNGLGKVQFFSAIKPLTHFSYRFMEISAFKNKHVSEPVSKVPKRLLEHLGSPSSKFATFLFPRAVARKNL